MQFSNFSSTAELKRYVGRFIHERDEGIQRGIITDMAQGRFDPDADFIKIGRGSLGGKARGLAFASTLLKENPGLHRRFEAVDIRVPKTVAISTEGFDAFTVENGLKALATREVPDAEIAAAFQQARFPDWLERDLSAFAEHTRCPL